mmetsp:Transcript_9530/g.13324  ORF Transcript_9530/g.13324 Transcript_9530/m.13324 type:complete len:267 (-) Transcript_9530:166-966(-)|eukprot:CAMPEP_0184483738 /NCGR_PEP_ID=MMETSP0113_2-20130426/5413_1 /TAXON_ID=91329 /ORGANISM="Norrisiella sphaerica, Strain BC52" /LENGTH=266 /DNA_ID=CAMNT_0026864321 /DNA_START=84 /DNA_END=884 /DNA_ORIENTATION=+
MSSANDPNFPMAFKGPGLFQSKGQVEVSVDKGKTPKPVTTVFDEEPKKEIKGFPLKFSGPGLFSRDGRGTQKSSPTTLEEHVGHYEAEPETSESKSEEAKTGRRTVFLCLDRSNFAVQVMDWCVKKMFQPTDRVVFIHVNLFAPLHMDLYPSLALDYVKENERIYNGAVQQGTRFLKAAVSKCMKLGRRPDEYKLLLGNKNTNSEKHALLQCINKHKPDFVVVGSRGMGTFGRTFLGSTSDYLAHNASCPVLIVRCTSQEKAESSA